MWLLMVLWGDLFDDSSDVVSACDENDKKCYVGFAKC